MISKFKQGDLVFASPRKIYDRIIHPGGIGILTRSLPRPRGWWAVLIDDKEHMFTVLDLRGAE